MDQAIPVLVEYPEDHVLLVELVLVVEVDAEYEADEQTELLELDAAVAGEVQVVVDALHQDGAGGADQLLRLLLEAVLRDEVEVVVLVSQVHLRVYYNPFRFEDARRQHRQFYFGIFISFHQLHKLIFKFICYSVMLYFLDIEEKIIVYTL